MSPHNPTEISVHPGLVSAMAPGDEGTGELGDEGTRILSLRSLGVVRGRPTVDDEGECRDVTIACHPYGL